MIINVLARLYNLPHSHPHHLFPQEVFYKDIIIFQRLWAQHCRVQQVLQDTTSDSQNLQAGQCDLTGRYLTNIYPHALGYFIWFCCSPYLFRHLLGLNH